MELAPARALRECSANCVRHGSPSEHEYCHRDENQHELCDGSHKDGPQGPGHRLLRARRRSRNRGWCLAPYGLGELRQRFRAKLEHQLRGERPVRGDRRSKSSNLFGHPSFVSSWRLIGAASMAWRPSRSWQACLAFHRCQAEYSTASTLSTATCAGASRGHMNRAPFASRPRFAPVEA